MADDSPFPFTMTARGQELLEALRAKVDPGSLRERIAREQNIYRDFTNTHYLWTATVGGVEYGLSVTIGTMGDISEGAGGAVEELLAKSIGIIDLVKGAA